MKQAKYLTTIILISILSVCAPDHSASEHSEKNQVVSEILNKGSISWDGTPLPDYPRGKPEITILKVIIPAKSKIPLHKHPVINAGFIIKGELTLFSEDKQQLGLKAGDSAIELVNKWHYAENNTDKEVELIVFYAGSPGNPLTVKKE